MSPRRRANGTEGRFVADRWRWERHGKCVPSDCSSIETGHCRVPASRPHRRSHSSATDQLGQCGVSLTDDITLASGATSVSPASLRSQEHATSRGAKRSFSFWTSCRESDVKGDVTVPFVFIPEKDQKSLTFSLGLLQTAGYFLSFATRKQGSARAWILHPSTPCSLYLLSSDAALACGRSGLPPITTELSVLRRPAGPVIYELLG
jgi:hypothetical protein